MAKLLLLVRSGPSRPEREAEYNDWYDSIHLPDLLKIKGVKAASRYRAATPQFGGGSIDGPGYLAIYEIEVDDPQDFYDGLGKGVADGVIRMTDAIAADPSGMSMWEEITPRVS
jgi:hypothetical protein